MLIDAVAPGKVGLIDMNARGGLPGTGTPYVIRAFDALAHGVIDYVDAVRVQRGAQEGFNGGVVDFPDFLIVVKILHDGRMPHQRKAFAVQRQVWRDRAGVEDGNGVRFGQHRALRLACRRVVGIGSRLAGRGSEIVQLAGNEGKRLDFLFLQAHGHLPDVDVFLILVAEGLPGSPPWKKTTLLSATRVAGEKPSCGCPRPDAAFPEYQP